MQTFNLNGRPHVTLDNLLKFEGWCESGGIAKQMIAAGLVQVDGKIETRKRCKITAGNTVKFESQQIIVTE